MRPQVPIEVDSSSGIWTTDGLPMLYVPRHFFVNNHVMVESALGRERYAQLLSASGHRSAWFWCDSESATHELEGAAVFEHYLKRLSQRGWGQFSFEALDAERGTAEIRVRKSAFVLAQPQARGRLCYMFEGWLCGAMDWVLQRSGPQSSSACVEASCASEGASFCTFKVGPRAPRD